jgi:MFS family permease
MRDPLLAEEENTMLLAADGGPMEDDVISKSKSPLRWPVLVLACLMLVGSYYCFDIPSALKTQINDYMQDPAKQYETDFALMYTLYAAPNILLPFFGGYFVDRFGVGFCLLVFTSLIAVGQVAVTIGFIAKSWPIIFLGRLIFALGGENLIVANSALLADWFKGKELAFAFGINLSIARVGSVINNILSPALTRSVGLIFALWFGAFTCVASMACVVLTIPLDRKLDLQIAAQKKLSLDSRLAGVGSEKVRQVSSSSAHQVAYTSSTSAVAHEEEEEPTFLGVLFPPWMNPWASPGTGERSPLTAASSIQDADLKKGSAAGASLSSSSSLSSSLSFSLSAPALHHRVVGGPPSDGEAGTPGSGSGSGGGNDDRRTSSDGGEGGEGAAASVQCKDVATLPHIFWVLVAFCVVMYGSVLPFNNISSSLLLERNYFIEAGAGCRLEHSGQCQSDPSNPPFNCTNQQLSFYQPPLPVNVTLDGVSRCHGPPTGPSGGLQCLAGDVDCSDPVWWTSGGGGCAQEYCDRLFGAEKNAAWVMSIPYTISGVVSPVIGFVIDKYGHRASIATFAAGLVVAVHLSLGYSSVSPVGPLVGQGLAYTGFAAVLWPAVPLVIQPRLTGLGFGIVTSALNAGCAALPIVVAQVFNDSQGHYLPNCELLFALLGVCGLLLGFYLNYFDYHHGHILNRGEQPSRVKRSSGDGWRTSRGEGKYKLLANAQADNELESSP